MAEKAKEAPKSFARRDLLQSLERQAQAEWESKKVFETDAFDASEPKEKYFSTFPYPYMNGVLHLGHTFSMSKVEFAVSYERMKGKRTLWPFGFHCTGMPIQAAANKLTREIETFGNPPQFPDPKDEAPKEEASTVAEVKDLSQHRGKKTKAVAKKGSAWQWNILLDMGVAPEEIPKFTDPLYWLRYFPPIAVEHLKQFGIKVDWRRSFITTSVNPYYDSFIRWQFNKLRRLNKLKFGKRFSIYSPLDGQLCADHDRSQGEGVLPQEYTLIKLDLLQPFPAPLQAKLGQFDGQRISLLAATLRPETMCGQTNCWVLPDGEYGVYELESGLVVCAARAARNMAYQYLTPKFGEIKQVASVTGWDLLGAPIRAPMSPYERVYCLPMLTISLVKGTGIVTSVPSDAPDDYMALKDLKSKQPMREKFHITDEMVLPFEPVEIIDIPEMGRMAAPTLCEEMKIKSQNDRVALAEAKDKVYMKGFYEGVMIAGSFPGEKVMNAKQLTREKLIAEGDALVYAEPEKYVESRSGEECVVALTDQWYITYGEPEWRAQVEQHLKETLETYSEETHRLFDATLGWLKEWGCSRSFGLGTALPWDSQYVIESLSDSTVYMAYYTVAHLLQSDLEGKVPGAAGIDSKLMTDDVWEYILADSAYPGESCGVSEQVLTRLRNEFRYWYPVDLRSSGKDLIQNHLTFFLYNHAALFPREMWPRSIRTNGHVLLNNEKMSKSSGNFLTLIESVNRYGVDATRLALAQAGDTNDDANFDEEVANSAILRLTNEIKWYEEMVALRAKGGLRSGEWSTTDKIFDNDISKLILDCESGFRRHNFRDASNYGFFELQIVRDSYRAQCMKAENMHGDLVARFLEVQALLLSPFCPHVCEQLWKILGKEGFIVNAPFPAAGAVDPLLARKGAYVQRAMYEFRKKKAESAKGLMKKGHTGPPPSFSKLEVVVADAFLPYQVTILKTMQSVFDGKTFGSNLKGLLMSIDELKANPQDTMKFSKFVEEDVAARGAEAFELSLPFSEIDVLNEMREFLVADLQIADITILSKSDGAATNVRAASATPGKPVSLFTV